jgi:hypothetical protein
MSNPIRTRLGSSLAAICTIGAATLGHAQAPGTTAAAMDCAKVLEVTDHATMDHGVHQGLLKQCAARSTGTLPTSAGQAAYGAMSEIVRILEADSTTDWARVNIEALRMHLVDMDEVTMRARVVQRQIPGGIEVDVTGTGTTVAAIQRMVPSHSRAMDATPEYRSATSLLPNGVRFIVTSEKQSDAARVVRIRGLGFAGLLTTGDHHARHHLSLARGDAAAHAH